MYNGIANLIEQADEMLLESVLWIASAMPAGDASFKYLAPSIENIETFGIKYLDYDETL